MLARHLNRQRTRGRWAVLPIVVLVAAACAPAASPTPTVGPTEAATATPAGTAAATVTCTGFTTVKPGVLTVVVYDGEGLPDLQITNGVMGGLEGALLNAFAKDCNLTIELYQTQFGSMILAVQQHKADVGTDIFWNSARAKQIYYTGPYQVADHAAVFTLTSKPFTTVAALTTVGTVTGFVWAPYLQSALGDNGKLFPDQTTGVTALLNGQIDGWVNGLTSLSSPPLSDHATEITGTKLAVGDFGMPEAAVTNSAYQMVACDNKGLAGAIDSEQAKLVGDGTWAQVKTQYSVTTDPTLKQPEQGC